MTKRTTLLLLSGGLDSTTCLFKLLTETDDDVHTFYVDVVNNKDKVWCEKQAIYRLKSVAEGIREFTHHVGTTFDLDGHTQGGIQPLMWMIAASMMLNKIDGPRKRLCIGYTLGDPILEDPTDLIEHWKYLWKWLGRGRQIPMHFPLVKQTKGQSMDYLRRLEHQRGIEIIKHLWTCEGPERDHGPNSSGYRACKRCVPCKRGMEIGLVQP